MADLSRELLAWYQRHARGLPWRATREPYPVWVSEAMCQQTQIATVLPYYARWMERLPSVESLAGADEATVLGLWQGLGYYRRAKFLHAGARYVVEHGWPRSRDEWLSVPGVGRYTAGALASIVLGERVPVVDGNVERVCARLTGGNGTDPWKWATELVERVPGHPGEWNQALMELGALVCTPKSPACLICPVQAWCEALRLGLVGELPRPRSRPTPVPVERRVVLVLHEGRVGLRRIPEGEWWAGLFGLVPDLLVEPMVEVRHVVTRHRVVTRAGVRNGPTPGLEWFAPEELDEVPMPAPDRRALERLLPPAQVYLEERTG